MKSPPLSWVPQDCFIIKPTGIQYQSTWNYSRYLFSLYIYLYFVTMGLKTHCLYVAMTICLCSLHIGRSQHNTRVYNPNNGQTYYAHIGGSEDSSSIRTDGALDTNKNSQDTKNSNTHKSNPSSSHDNDTNIKRNAQNSYDPNSSNEYVQTYNPSSNNNNYNTYNSYGSNNNHGGSYDPNSYGGSNSWNNGNNVPPSYGGSNGNSYGGTNGNGYGGSNGNGYGYPSSGNELQPGM